MNKEEYLSIIEAILFVSNKPVKTADLKESLGIDIESTKELLLELEEKIRFSGINIASTKKGFLLIPNEKYKKFYEKYIKRKKQKFSKLALEVIAILYAEPKTKEAIDKLRGVNSAKMLNQLIKRGSVKKELKDGKVVYTLSESLVRAIGPEIQKSIDNSNLFESNNY